MLSQITPRKSQRNRLQIGLKISASVLLAALAVQAFRGGRASAQGVPATIARIEGDDLEVATMTPSGMETDAAPTIIANGSEVTLRSGHAVMTLNEGGDISVCGPARFKLLQSAGAITLALDYGRVHPMLDSADTFTIYTPTIVATPIAVASKTRDMTVGLEQGGEMCVLTKRGAMRIEPQFSDQSLIVPQGGTASFSGGQIESLGGFSACTCDFPRPGVEHGPPSPPPPSREIATLSHPLPPDLNKNGNSAPPSVSAEEPVYTVIMPPLRFDANEPVPPPDPDPETILLVREVRVRPSAVFSGHVNPAPPQIATALAAAPAPPEPDEDRHVQNKPGLMARVRNFFRTLTGWGHCAGAGCKE